MKEVIEITNETTLENLQNINKFMCHKIAMITMNILFEKPFENELSEINEFSKKLEEWFGCKTKRDELMPDIAALGAVLSFLTKETNEKMDLTTHHALMCAQLIQLSLLNLYVKENNEKNACKDQTLH